MKSNRFVFSLSFVVAAALLAVVVGIVVGKASAGGRETGDAGPGRISSKRIDVIVKATDSSFWQSMLAGAKQAAGDLGVEVGLFGPTSETDVSKQVQLIENSVSRGVDAVVLAANSRTALDAAISRARQSGLKVITVDGQVQAKTEGFIGTNNINAGEKAGVRLCELIKANNKQTGTVFVGSAVAGVGALIDRDAGFRKGIKQSCPALKVTQTRYNNNDIATAAAQADDAITAIPDLVGVFAANNSTGDGTARAIRDNKAEQRIPVVAFDSDPQENAALANGALDALVVQNPYFFGYQGVTEAVAAAVGSQVPVNLDPGAVLADRGNMKDPMVHQLLNPPRAGASK